MSRKTEQDCIKTTVRSLDLNQVSRSLRIRITSDSRTMDEKCTAEVIAQKSENDVLRKTIAYLHDQNKQWIERNKGLVHLANQLHDTIHEVASLEAQNRRLKESLTRAENRIAQLSLMASNENSSRGAIVTPGVSKKILECLSRENTRLRGVVKQMTARASEDAIDLATENCDLHDVIVKLRDDRDGKRQEIQELEKLLHNIQGENVDELKHQNMHLVHKVTELSKKLDIKQVFCETIVTENETLKRTMQSSEGKKTVYVREVKSVIGKSLAAREVMSQVWDEKGNGSDKESDNDDLEEKQNGGVWGEDGDDVDDDDDDDDHSKTLRGEDMEKLIEKEKGLRMESDAAGLRQQVRDLQRRVERQHDLETALTAEIEQAKQERNALQQEKEQLQEQTNQMGQIIGDRDAEVKNLKGEVNGLRTNLSKAISAGEILQKELDESRDENKLMQGALVTYENDFKRECDEKRDTMHQLQEMKARLEHEMDKHAELRGRYLELMQRVSSSLSACRARVYPNETSLPDTPQPPRRSVRSVNELQCSVCHRMFPHYLLENHMRDCSDE